MSGHPQYPWSEGDPLFADALNAAISGSGDYIATGGTAARSGADRASEWLSVRDYGGRFDGATNDTAAFAAARAGAVSQAVARGSAGGFMRTGGGKLTAFAFPAYATKPVHWYLDGLTYDGSQPVLTFNQGDLFETFFSGTKYLARDDTGISAGSIGTLQRIEYTGPGTSLGILGIKGVHTDGSGYMWGISTALTLSKSGSGQSVGIASQVNRTAGNSPSFVYYGSSTDQTGLGQAVSGAGSVGFELDLSHNGPEPVATLYNPTVGGRVHMALNSDAWIPPIWQAAHAYTIGTVISPSNGFTYIVQTAGTSGASAPTWPVSTGTVADGGVTWAFATTVATQQSRVIDIGGHQFVGAISIGAGVNFLGKYYDAPIEMSAATLDTATNANAAAIRLAANMPIDFSGNGTLAGQNLHTLRYDSATSKLFYAVAGVNKWSVDASGNMRVAGTVTPSVTP